MRALGHVTVDVSVRGRKGEHRLKVFVDTGAAYTVLPLKVLRQVGAVKTPHPVAVELGDGRKVEADVYVATVAVKGREGPALILTFKDAKTVLGVQALEALGLKVNPSTGRLEATRPKGVAYFYQSKLRLDRYAGCARYAASRLFHHLTKTSNPKNHYD